MRSFTNAIKHYTIDSSTLFHLPIITITIHYKYVYLHSSTSFNPLQGLAFLLA